MKRLLLLAAVTAMATADAQATQLYQANFSSFVSIDHDSLDNVIEPSPQFGANFSIGYPEEPASDQTLNFFETTEFSLISSDFGGDHWMETNSIDVSGWDEVNIDVVANFVGRDSFNNSPAEFIEYYYALDGGFQTQFFFFTDDPNGFDLNANQTVDVTGAFSLVVGVNANVNGADDGWEMTSLIVNGTDPVGGSVESGDFNGDRIVDLADYTVWRNNLGASGSGIPGDGNNDTRVDSLDYELWKSQFGQTVTSSFSSTSVPEQSGLAIISLIACFFSAMTLKRRKPL